MHQQVNEIPLPEAHSPDEVMVHTLALLRADIPGFIIRHQTGTLEVDAEQVHKDNVAKMKALVEGLHPDNKLHRDELGKFVLGQKEVGRFHHDVQEDKRENITTNEVQPLVHTTTSGGGRVTAAKLGTNFERAKVGIWTRFGPRSTDDHPDHPHNTLIRGVVDPELVNPNVHVGEVRKGDSVVLATGYSSNAAWHRMDTDPNLGERNASVTRLLDKDNKGIKIAA